MSFLQFLKLVSEKNIGGRDVAKDESKLGFIILLLEGVAYDLCGIG